MSLPAPTVTGWSTFWHNVAPAGQGSAYSLYGNRTANERRVDHHLGKPGFKQYRRVMRALLGASVGGTATETVARVSAPAGLTESQLLGGVRTIDTITIVDRVTTSADLTAMQAITDRTYNMAPAIASYPTDLSGNGGGGKAGR